MVGRTFSKQILEHQLFESGHCKSTGNVQDEANGIMKSIEIIFDHSENENLKGLKVCRLAYLGQNITIGNSAIFSDNVID